jgi:hypothetical protein
VSTRVQLGHPLGTEGKLSFSPRSFNPLHRRIAKRRTKTYNKYGKPVLMANRDS